MCQGRYALCYKEEDVKDMIQNTRQKTIDHWRQLMDTRCLFSASLASFILNRHDQWTHTSIDRILGQGVMAASIEIDVTDILDHIFIVFKDPDQGYAGNGKSRWWIIQSYINRYTATIEPIDIEDLVATIQRWMVQGVKSDEWQHFFHAPMPSTNRCHPHVYTINRYIGQDIQSAINVVEERLQSMLSSPGNYLQIEPYKTLALE